jgi:hypothetical protein
MNGGTKTGRQRKGRTRNKGDGTALGVIDRYDGEQQHIRTLTEFHPCARGSIPILAKNSFLVDL